MPYATKSVGRNLGQPFMGIHQRIKDEALQDNQAADGNSFRIDNGVLQSGPGKEWATHTDIGTEKYALLDGVSGIYFDHTDAYDLRVRWTVIVSFRTPSALPSKGYIFSKQVEIDGTLYDYPGVYVNSVGRVYVSVVDSVGGDKSFSTSEYRLQPDTDYVLQLTRYDTNAYLWIGTDTVSPAMVASTALLGKLDYPESESDQPLCIGGVYDGAAWSSAFAIEAHEFTMLDSVILHTDFGYTSYADPLDDRCIINTRFDDASGHFTDHSTHGNNSANEDGVDTYALTTNAFVNDIAPVTMIAELSPAGGTQRVVTVTNGTINSGMFFV